MNNCIQHADLLGSEEALAIKAVILASMKIACTFCNGSGHQFNDCSSRRGLDRSFKRLGFGCTWGTIKSSMIRTSVEAAIFTRAERSGIKERMTKFVLEQKRSEKKAFFEASRAKQGNG